jgi:hypothetical protein
VRHHVLSVCVADRGKKKGFQKWDSRRVGDRERLIWSSGLCRAKRGRGTVSFLRGADESAGKGAKEPSLQIALGLQKLMASTSALIGNGSW